MFYAVCKAFIMVRNLSWNSSHTNHFKNWKSSDQILNLPYSSWMLWYCASHIDCGRTVSSSIFIFYTFLYIWEYIIMMRYCGLAKCHYEYCWDLSMEHMFSQATIIKYVFMHNFYILIVPIQCLFSRLIKLLKFGTKSIFLFTFFVAKTWYLDPHCIKLLNGPSKHSFTSLSYDNTWLVIVHLITRSPFLLLCYYMSSTDIARSETYYILSKY